MLGLKLNRQTLRHAYHKTKNFIGQAYANTKGMLSDLDIGVRVARDIYSTLSGPMEAVLGENYKKGNKYVMNALTGYDDIRSIVMDTDENIKNHNHQIVGDLKKKKIFV